MKKIERSHDKEKIETKSNNFNLTVNSMKTLETVKAYKAFNDELLNLLFRNVLFFRNVLATTLKFWLTFEKEGYVRKRRLRIYLR